MGDRSALSRFLGGIAWTFPDASGELQLDAGECIMGEGGFAMVPWILDRYERILGLGPAEVWLLKRLIKHAWEPGKLVYVSQRKICIQARVSRPTLAKLFRHLESGGYIRRVGHGAGMDRRVRYDVSPTYAALALVAAADPRSKWAQAHRLLSIQEICSKFYAGPHGRQPRPAPKKNGHHPWHPDFGFDFSALQRLIEGCDIDEEGD
jgi:hypothetical protein